MTKEQAIKGLKENLCSLCAYGSQNMDSCDIRECDNRDYIKALEQQPSEDCVSRQAVLDCLTATGLKKFDFILDARKKVNNLPSVTPTQGTCKDCKNYVVGALDEEICLRGHELIHKDFYCADFEKRGNKVGWSSLENVREKVERGSEE